MGGRGASECAGFVLCVALAATRLRHTASSKKAKLRSEDRCLPFQTRELRLREGKKSLSRAQCQSQGQGSSSDLLELKAYAWPITMFSYPEAVGLPNSKTPFWIKKE